MKIQRTKAGFTLAELIIAVGILSILMGLAAVNIIHYQRVLTQVELDGIAREIFVAAQNHLTMAESQGLMGILAEEKKIDNDGTKAPDDKATEKSILLGSQYAGSSDTYYYVVNGDIQKTLNMLNVMLPFASIDETVRSGGSYVIRYQKSPALVLDVFYATKSGRFKHTFEATEADKNNKDSLWNKYLGSDKKEARREYGTDNTVIGWYGADGQSVENQVQPGEPLQAPTIKVVNAEQLYVEVNNPNSDWRKYQYAKLRLEITGKKSGATYPLNLINEENSNPKKEPYILPNNETDTSYFKVILDDVTQNGTHFAKIVTGLQPGEDIEIRAVAYNNKQLTNIASTAGVTTNSLYDSLNTSTNTAKIANFRHLENLDHNISSVSVTVEAAEQICDMDWTGFKGKVINPNPQYVPITNDKTITYDGKNYQISNVEINVDDGNAGLFATLGHTSTVKNLELLNFSVNSDNGKAGALAGFLDGSKVQNVLVHHETGKSGDGYKITGKTSVGGLIGEVSGTSTVTQSAAAVYVKSDNGDAGGLIGSIVSGATFNVSDSYAGGHTKEGSYEKDKAEKEYYNVTGKTNAGGLIGSSEGTLIMTNCYATTSAGPRVLENGTTVDGTTAGGLIGSTSDGTITNCYVTGLVTGTTVGAFVGKSEGSPTYTGNGYFSLVTGELPPIEEGTTVSDDNISAWDDKFDAYGKNGAIPYDGSLNEGLYTFKTISELNNTATSLKWMTTHYGDWPPIDTLVINTAG